MKSPSFRPNEIFAAVLASAILAGCQSAPPLPPTSPELVGEVKVGSGYLRGYLDRKALPNSLALLPKPPADGSPELAADMAVYIATRDLRGTARWNMAAQDANLKFPNAASTFACTMDLPISQEQTPHLNMLLRRTLLDAGLSTYAAKDSYIRKRPFLLRGDLTCAPKEEAALNKDGSYPSGHSALGWAWALILSEVAPERANAILARGLAFGQSRVICGVHWQSDVDAGRMMGAATVAALHADPTFTAQLAAAKAEVANARGKSLHASGDCKAESAALAK
ncbi:MAG: acid phosphatase [Burkholderiales bacterium RIFCSPLOWO2_12_FULL_61_40]|nr:MAG: acid phosphatase [Burkholderiales bacterium RIFCSPLOWO2_12_FULL_61_40]